MASSYSQRALKDTQSGGTITSNSKRLPAHIVPDSYLICLKARWDQGAFEGCVIVHLNVSQQSLIPHWTMPQLQLALLPGDSGSERSMAERGGTKSGENHVGGGCD